MLLLPYLLSELKLGLLLSPSKDPLFSQVVELLNEFLIYYL